MKKIWFLIIGVSVLCTIFSTMSYPYLPEKIASHWNASGEVDGYMNKFLGVFLLPLILVGIILLFAAIPKIDPLKKNIQKFYNYYLGFIFIFVIYMTLIQTWMIAWNLGIEINSNIIMPLMMGILFIYIGFLLEKTERNWSIGIRTPWTLSNDMVWKKTHKLGAKLFFVSGILALAGIFFSKYSFLFISAPVLLSSLVLIIYSYIIFRKLRAKISKQ